MDTFDRISELLKKNSMTQADLSRATGISTGLISQWKKRMQSPSVDKLKIIADYFGVSVDYLLTGEETEQKEKPAKNDEAKIDRQYTILSREAKKLTSEQRQQLIDMAKIMFGKEFDDT